MEPWRPDVEPAPTIALIVATYGDESWEKLGRATRDRLRPQFDEGLAVHGPDLAGARNLGAMLATTGWLCFVDADDTLAPDYVDRIRPHLLTGRLLAPAAQPVTDGAVGPVEHFHGRNIRHLNPCIISTAVERDLFHHVGGFLDEPLYEDWSLWLRCVRAGAAIVHVPSAVYRVRLRAGSRNDQPEPFKRRWYWQIRRSYA